MKCIDTNSVMYKKLLELTGLEWYELNALIRDYYEKYGDIPTVDKCLTVDYDTSQHLIKHYGLRKYGNDYTTKNGEVINQVEINNLYRDLEVSVKPRKYSNPVITIKQRALPNRTLPSNNIETGLPLFILQTSELLPVSYNEDGSRIYEHNGYYYVSKQRIANIKTLLQLPKFNSLEEAETAILEFKPSITGAVIMTIKNNSNKLEAGLDLNVITNANLPDIIRFYKNFKYPQFTIDYNLKESYKINDGHIILNPESLENIEEDLLRILGYSEEQIKELINNLGDIVEYETIKTGKSQYTIRQNESSNIIQQEMQKPKQNSFSDNLEPMLDRLEELYGITFNRITNDEIRNSHLYSYVPNATLVNAFIFDGEIYINMDNAKVDAPIHELSHLLLGTIRLTNPELYMLLVNSVEQYPEYAYELKKYPNRVRSDANEEIFVDLFARAYTGQLDLGLDLNIIDDMEYEIRRNIDSAIFPNKSTTTEDLSILMGKSLNEIMTIFGTVINKDNVAKAFSDDVGKMSRYMANVKESLIKSNDLKEYCNG